MKGMILAAGYGTRLRPITHTLPKPMVPLLNRPLIAWAVESFLAAGVRELVVNLHHLPEPLERYLNDEYGQRAEFFFSYESEILGTGGGIRRVRPQLEREDEFFLVNGDTVQFPRWDTLRRSLRALDAVAALTMRHAPGNDKFTPVYLDGAQITGFGKGTGEALMFAGSHVISTRIFDYIPNREFSGIVEHAYQPLLDAGREKIAGVVDDGLWFDIGTPQRYISASRVMLEETIRGGLRPVPGTRLRGDSLLHETARGNASRSVVGAGSVIDGDVRDSIIWDDCHIAAGAIVEGCIVTHGVTLVAGEYRNQMIVPGESIAI
ncbi:MAG TPA: NDP-sugar synthase [Thermoanaerobaculia bacterium]|nr:NDP-sugar synthase [Thermoanaerobaculia bacterium]